MRFLIDNNLSPGLVKYLGDFGIEAAHLREFGLSAAPDESVLEFARGQSMVLLSADTDFGTILARTGMDRPSVVLIRRLANRRAGEQAALLAANLTQIDEDLDAGAVVVISDDVVRIRRLPLGASRR